MMNEVSENRSIRAVDAHAASATPEQGQPSAEKRRDRAIEADLREAISSHMGLLYTRDVRLWVDGGVAHLTGSIGSIEEQSTLRKVVGRMRGIYAVWDLLERPDRKPLRVIDIGCGGHKQVNEAIGVDRFPCPLAEVVADLECGLPFGNDSVDHIFAVHVLEHVVNLIPLMNDIHRVLKADGVLHVMVPYWRHEVAVADPTHVRFFVAQSFKVFCRRTRLVSPFLPLTVSFNKDTVFADLVPDKEGQGAGDEDVVRFFL
jgi:SAM-dependent methyltransferase